MISDSIEIPQVLRYLMITNGICDFFLGFISYPTFTDVFAYAYGVTLIILGIFAILATVRQNLAQIMILLEISIIWQLLVGLATIMILIIFSHLLGPSFSYSYPWILWVSMIILLSLIIVNSYYYHKFRSH